MDTCPQTQGLSTIDFSQYSKHNLSYFAESLYESAAHRRFSFSEPDVSDLKASQASTSRVGFVGGQTPDILLLLDLVRNVRGLDGSWDN